MRRPLPHHIVIIIVALVAAVFLCAGPRQAGGLSRPARAPVNDPRPLPPNDTTTSLRLDLNLPAYRLDVVEHGARVRSIDVAIGMTGFRTPIGAYRVDFVVWNPWWIPPDSPWAAKERPHPPGWSNPVGRVKLHVQELVFLHGTPFVSSLGSAASHACIRMRNEDAMGLAELVHRHAGPDLSGGLLDSLRADTSLTRTIRLARAVPITVRYALAEVRDDTLLVHRDVYRLAGGAQSALRAQVLAALVAGGHDSAGVRPEVLRAILQQARRRSSPSPLRIPVDSVVQRAAGT